MARYSEEQWKDLKFKLIVLVILGVIGGGVYAIGPGLDKFLARARLRKTEAWAPKHYYNIGRIYEATYRKEKAKKVYEEFYLLWSGDERVVEGLDTLCEEIKWPTPIRAYWPAIAAQYTPETRPPWIGGDEAKAHPMLADVLMRVCRLYEDDRLYHEAQFAYQCVLRFFPPGTPAHGEAKIAEKRGSTRGF